MMDLVIWGVLGFFAFIIIAIVLLSIYIVNQWEKAIVLRFGKIVRTSDAGFHFKNPITETVKVFDTRMTTIDMKGQLAITKDNISVGIDAVVFMKIEDAEKTLLNIVDYEQAISKFAQTSLRDIVGKYDLDTLLSNREDVAKSLKTIVDSLASNWGIDVNRTEIQEISLPSDMKRAFAVQAEAEREAKAVKIAAKAELEAAETLKKAGEELEKNPIGFQLRTLQTLSDVSKDQSNTIIFALPTETIRNAGIGGLAAMASINSSNARDRTTVKE